MHTRVHECTRTRTTNETLHALTLPCTALQEFDCLKSLEIEEKISQIAWLPARNRGLFVLASNDKTIKFWKIRERKIRRPVKSLIRSGVIPELEHAQTVTTVNLKRTFANAHSYHINSISCCSDGEIFMSCDDLRVNLWNLEVSSLCFQCVDLKPQNLSELTEVITKASFHPSEGNVFMYGTSRGAVRMGDLRESALCDSHAKTYQRAEGPDKSFFSELTSSISDAHFTPDGRQIITRDYMTMKVWDVKIEREPVAVIPVHEYLRMHLCGLYENDCMFDKFSCASSGDGSKLLTGSYDNHFMLHNMANGASANIKCMEDSPKQMDPMLGTPDPPDVNFMDFGKKVQHLSWHPRLDVVGIAGLNKLYIYQAIT
jgi:serine/threonine-protein phosphatase 2A regulatory subunit B